VRTTATLDLAARRSRTRRHLREAALAALVHLALASGAGLVLVPLAWMLSTSLKDPGDVFLFPPQWIPSPVEWGNYAKALTVLPFGTYFKNTALITGLDVVGKVLTSTIVAFGFARLRWYGRDAVFMLMLSTLMLPHHVTLIPQFILFRELGWFDTLLPLIVPAFFGGPFLIFLLRQFYMTIPLDLDDAARIDGAGTFRIYWSIVLPLSRPALAACAIFVFNSTWNDFLGPLIYLQSPDRFTLALGLRQFLGEYATEWHLLMAASLVALTPVLLLFFTAQRYFIQGVVFTGLKG
jgi:ABC-type glycerol-3-phosphate transport system permease component